MSGNFVYPNDSYSTWNSSSSSSLPSSSSSSSSSSSNVVYVQPHSNSLQIIRPTPQRLASPKTYVSNDDIKHDSQQEWTSNNRKKTGLRWLKKKVDQGQRNLKKMDSSKYISGIRRLSSSASLRMKKNSFRKNKSKLEETTNHVNLPPNSFKDVSLPSKLSSSERTRSNKTNEIHSSPISFAHTSRSAWTSYTSSVCHNNYSHGRNNKLKEHEKKNIHLNDTIIVRRNKLHRLEGIEVTITDNEEGNVSPTNSILTSSSQPDLREISISSSASFSSDSTAIPAIWSPAFLFKPIHSDDTIQKDVFDCMTSMNSFTTATMTTMTTALNDDCNSWQYSFNHLTHPDCLKIQVQQPSQQKNKSIQPSTSHSSFDMYAFMDRFSCAACSFRLNSHLELNQ